MQGQIIGEPYAGTHNAGNWESDNAIDISAHEGSPVFAVADGVIGPQFGTIPSADSSHAGLRVHIQTANNEFYYGHLSSFAPGLAPGAQVRLGQHLGYSGTANGVPHLHFASRVGDPRYFYLGSVI